jgi:hypothetical protein
MSDLAVMAKIPGVKSAVLGDLDGALHDAVRETNGEAVAAEMGFVSSSLMEAGELLGLGGLGSVSFGGPTSACVVVLRARSVITAVVEPPKMLGSVEKAIETSFQEWA